MEKEKKRKSTSTKTTTTTTTTSAATSDITNNHYNHKSKKHRKNKSSITTRSSLSSISKQEKAFWKVWENSNITSRIWACKPDFLIPYRTYEDANSIKWLLENDHVCLFIEKVKNRDINLSKWYYLNEMPDKFTEINDQEFFEGVHDLLSKHWHLMERRLEEFVKIKLNLPLDRKLKPAKKKREDSDTEDYDIEKWIMFSNHSQAVKSWNNRYKLIVQDVLDGDNVENAKKVIEHCKCLHLIPISPKNLEIIALLSHCNPLPKITLEKIYPLSNFEEIVQVLLKNRLITKAETDHLDKFQTKRNLVYLLKNGFNYHFDKINANMKENRSKINCIPTFFKLTGINEREMMFFECPFFIRECILNFTQQEFSEISFDYPNNFNFADYILDMRLYRYPSVEDYENIDLNRIDVTLLAKTGCTDAIRAYMNKFYPSLEATTPRRKENVLNLLHTTARHCHTHIYRMLADEFPHVYIFVHTPETAGKDIYDFEELKSIYIAIEKANWALCDYILDDLLLVPPLHSLAEFCKVNITQMIYLCEKFPKIRFSYVQSQELYTYPLFVKYVESKKLLDCWVPRDQIKKQNPKKKSKGYTKNLKNNIHNLNNNSNTTKNGTKNNNNNSNNNHNHINNNSNGNINKFDK
ncbi:hypothetical protein CYY_002312 [Polysphondylium violaceum]|uniref:Uncharacterized protein n=1 Tax=Polysphondylium violaceum TaxID=133409 RepID=A0A8J4Q1I8_9MYCE|nr:hypothetical protein CYY_002312 [Polysphondylium violaceum]